MLINTDWLNELIEGPDLSPDEIERLCTRQGFPIDERSPLTNGAGELFDVEVTSNRGDCISHLGVAREVAAGAGRAFALPQRTTPDAAGKPVSVLTDVDNQTPDVCPLFTARVITGARVGPSPKWLVDRLASVGQKSINCVVDASNYVLFETGQPTHTFDLNTLDEKRLVVRYASAGEELVALDGVKHKLRDTDLVVADARRPVSLAGVIGGLDTGVTEKTTDILLEAATWDPVTIRTAARRLRISTDAGHRFERVVDPGTIRAAAERLAAIICELTGGTLAQGDIERGPGLDRAEQRITCRAERCRAILGLDISAAEMAGRLPALGFRVETRDERTIECVVPDHRRHDVRREIDLIEEVARLHGFEDFHVTDRVDLQIAPPQPERQAQTALAGALTGMGFYETVTFTFVTHDDCKAFMPQGLRTLQVDEERRKGAPALRPSVIPSLLHCRRINQDNGAARAGEVRLFEFASVFAQTTTGDTVQHRNIALCLDAPDPQLGLRQLRGVIERLAREMGGAETTIGVELTPPVFPALDPDAHAGLTLGGAPLGYLALPTPQTLKQFGIDTPVAVAEINLDALLALYPPAATVHALPAFPAIERDLSVIVDEHAPWAAIEVAINSASPDRMVGLTFEGVYRGKQVGAGRKSVTLRMRFQDPDRTLRHDEVDPQVESVVSALKSAVGAELRA
ncbi:MAG: phenylalanine--tRNA ligase subunit beta [Phycisphaeraceae bacterium]|nr:phenylalanine--tRNA ligase subunit beta [Phycisphaeraceae bacterium]MCB9847053.1 phenylalanine--tRNA ligase subunit beta [Phycisphaeraceae bacterium]